MGQGWHVREAQERRAKSELRENDYSSFAPLVLWFYLNVTILETNLRPR